MQPLARRDATSNVTVSATVAATAKLTLSRTTVAFADADPDVVPSIDADGRRGDASTAKGKTSAGSNITLTLQAADDLTSGTDTIAISNVTWTATGAGFAAGTMSKASAATVGIVDRLGQPHAATLSFKLANSWDYATGNYSVDATYTLTAP